MPDDPNTPLMQGIHDKFGMLIAACCANSSVPPAFVAALIANESGGDPAARRFEPAVFATLAQVVMGRKPQYSPRGAKRALGGDELARYVDPSLSGIGTADVRRSIARLADLATSFGLTQIMGWHLVEFSSVANLAVGDPKPQIDFTLQLLAWFAEKYQLDLRMPGDPANSMVDAFFHCWNTGDPIAPTFDASYVPRGIARMAAYAALG